MSHPVQAPALHALGSAEILSVWERGTRASRTRRALLLLAAGQPDTDIDALARLPIGERDRRLLLLRRLTFGDRMSSVAECPACAERLEFMLNVSELLVPPPASERLAFRQDGWSLSLRPPDTLDLLSIECLSDIGRAVRALVARCVTEVARDEGEATVEALPEALIEHLSELLDAYDPQADVRLSLSCPACDHTWSARFDIADTLWREVASEARRVAWDVHLLATAYGWTEAEIFNLSATRRALYIQMVTG
ncbi:MAG: hypothetical protein H6739_36585 [Alphaproteobacteria bacterium]|nr:hypothetical protein [Alphaproteobacteria bacterium]